MSAACNQAVDERCTRDTAVIAVILLSPSSSSVSLPTLHFHVCHQTRVFPPTSPAPLSPPCNEHLLNSAVLRQSFASAPLTTNNDESSSKVVSYWIIAAAVVTRALIGWRVYTRVNAPLSRRMVGSPTPPPQQSSLQGGCLPKPVIFITPRCASSSRSG